MKFRYFSMLATAFIVLAASHVLKAAQPLPQEKITVEEIVAKHLESIGTAEARSATTSRVMQGSVNVTMRIGGSGSSQGGSVMASQGNMQLIGMIFGPQEFGNEKIAFDGRKLTIGEASPGQRTPLGGFIRIHDFLFKEGLLGGTLSTGWFMLDLAATNPKLKYGGTKKINDRQTHVVKYESRKGASLEVRLYFDAETFQHVRSEYTRTFPPPTVTSPEQAAWQKETQHKLVEEFSNFKKEGALNLPHTYKIQLSLNMPNGAVLQDWVLTFSQFVFNKQIDAKQFDLAAK